ncbi:MAG: transposase [Acidobacteria bacterium]|nr:transposase [Acidobacteriota bacterium]
MLSGDSFARWDLELGRASTGPKWLADERVADLVVETIRYGSDALGLYELRAWVVMVNHVHVLIRPHVPLARIMRTIKSFSGRRANLILGRSGPFWMGESYDHWVRGPEELERIVRYIERNPVAAGLVSRPEDWRWSSASS